MIERWQQLQEREQRLVIAMVIAIVVFLFYMMVWQPLNENLEKTEKKLNRQQDLLVWVQQKAAIFDQAKAQGARPKTQGSLSSVVNRTANRNKITITRMQPQGDNIQVWIDEVPFSQLLNWIEQLANVEGLIVKSIDLSAADQNGVVNVRRLQLGRS